MENYQTEIIKDGCCEDCKERIMLKCPDAGRDECNTLKEWVKIRVMAFELGINLN